MVKLKSFAEFLNETTAFAKYYSKYKDSADISDIEDFAKNLSSNDKKEFFNDLVKHFGYETDVSKSSKDVNKIKLLKTAIF